MLITGEIGLWAWPLLLTSASLGISYVGLITLCTCVIFIFAYLLFVSSTRM